MKPPEFEYHAPSTLDEALALLRDCGEDAKPLAGGQSLVPMMNFRLLHPSHLIDLNGIASLSYIRLEQDELCIGAMTRHRDVETSALLSERWPLLSGVMPHVAHVQIRNRGTIGGSLSHADPAAELPAVITALEGKLVLRSLAGSRMVTADDFFIGAMTTAIEPGELLVEIRIPPLPPATGWAFDELSRRRGDFAIVGVAALIHLDKSGLVDFARLTFAGVGDRPIRAKEAEAMLTGHRPDQDVLHRAAQAAAESLSPESDLHASSGYRRETAQTMARRVLGTSVERAKTAS